MFLKIVFSLSVLIGLFAIFYDPTYLDYVRNILLERPKSDGGKIFTKDELSQYNGVDKEELYLALLGTVFDVTNGSKHYGPGQSYYVFVGRDASRNFIDGNFDIEAISDDLVGLPPNHIKQLDYWFNFYKTQYKKIGKLIGRYYDEDGKLTQYGKEIRKLVKQSLQAEDDQKQLKRTYPPCNAEWDVKSGSRVWCTRKSGGIQRDWIGFPRKYYEPGSDNYRCVCISEENLSMGNIMEYDNCDSDAHSCYVET